MPRTRSTYTKPLKGMHADHLVALRVSSSEGRLGARCSNELEAKGQASKRR